MNKTPSTKPINQIYLDRKSVDCISQDNINNLFQAIKDLSLKKGDTFEFLPYNYFSNESNPSKYKAKREKIHTNLLIADIKNILYTRMNARVSYFSIIFLETLEQSNEK